MSALRDLPTSAIGSGNENHQHRQRRKPATATRPDGNAGNHHNESFMTRQMMGYPPASSSHSSHTLARPPPAPPPRSTYSHEHGARPYDTMAPISSQELQMRAREHLTTHTVIYMHKRDTSGERDHKGRPVQESWKDAVRRQVHDMEEHELLRHIDRLNQEGVTLAEKKEKMSESIQAELLEAWTELTSKEQDGHRFQYTLAQLDRELGPSHICKKPLYKTMDGIIVRRREGCKYHVEGGKSSKHTKVKHTMSVTAYFKREPRAYIDCLEILLGESGVQGDREEEDGHAGVNNESEEAKITEDQAGENEAPIVERPETPPPQLAPIYLSSFRLDLPFLNS